MNLEGDLIEHSFGEGGTSESRSGVYMDFCSREMESFMRMFPMLYFGALKKQFIDFTGRVAIVIIVELDIFDVELGDSCYFKHLFVVHCHDLIFEILVGWGRGLV